MAAIIEWERDLKRKNRDELLLLHSALDTLLHRWPMFQRELPELTHLRLIIWNEYQAQQNEALNHG